jgi:arginyl-tRNA synthetase
LHAFYRDCRVISDENVSPALSCARLRLVAATKSVFARVLGILGMSAPESM